MRRSDEHHVAETAGDQLDTAQDERAHDDVADLGVGLDERQQAAVIQLDHLARVDRTRPDQRSPAREHVDFARELARTVHGDDGPVRRAGPDDLDVPARDDEERDDRLADVEEDVSRRHLPQAAESCDPRCLGLTQRGKDLLGAFRARQRKGCGGNRHSCAIHSRLPCSHERSPQRSPIRSVTRLAHPCCGLTTGYRPA